MEQDDGHVVLDVRHQDEYNAGHIPEAILIPNESIGTEPPAELSDKNQIILIYCRSGNRSKQAAQKLFDMGYTNIYEFGGINTWKGEIVTEEASTQSEAEPSVQPDSNNGIWTRTDMPVSLRYDRMWEYSAFGETEDPEEIAAIVDALRKIEIGKPVDYAVDDYTDILTFHFEDGTDLRLEFEEENWVKDRQERFHAEGLETLRRMLDGLIEEESE